MRSAMGLSLVLCVSILWVGADTSQENYDFRSSDAYKKLSKPDREKLERAHEDMILLWGALDIYADQHKGELPKTLDDLIPEVLKALPSDPFADAEGSQRRDLPGYAVSKNGVGYGYRRGAQGNRAWIIRSVGLPSFPYASGKGQGLRLIKGLWISGINPLRKKQSDS